MISGEALKRDGMARAEAGASEEWKAAMLDCTLEVALKMPTFTSDEVFDLADVEGVEPHTENRAYGPIIARAAKLGYCRKLEAYPDTRKSRRPQLHATPLQIWESLIYQL